MDRPTHAIAIGYAALRAPIGSSSTAIGRWVLPFDPAREWRHLAALGERIDAARRRMNMGPAS